MANAKSNYLEDAVVDHFLGTASTSSPADVYVALFTSDPTDAGSGTEVTGGSYARQVAVFDAASGGSAANTDEIVFEDLPAATVTHLGVYDAATSGNLLWHGAANSSQAVGAGNTLTIPAGSLVVSET